MAYQRLRSRGLIISSARTDDSDRGTKGTYQRWAEVVGDDSYAFNKILRFFAKSPAFTPPNYAKRREGGVVRFDTGAFDPSGGPLQVSYSNFWQPFSDYVRTGFAKLGFKALSGLNSGELIGSAEFTFTLDPYAQTRSSSETSFLQAAIEKSTIQVYQQTLAKRIIFSENKTATGVQVVTSGRSYFLSAKREVILSAGTVSTRCPCVHPSFWRGGKGR